MSSTNCYTQGYSPATLSSHSSRTIHSDAAFLIPHIKPTDRILDVGCGPGTITIGFGQLAPQGRVWGIDISDHVLDQARSLVANNRDLDHVTFHKGDVLTPGGLKLNDGEVVKEGTFDVVFSSQLFPHLGTPEMREGVLREMRRLVKTGGIVATRDAAELGFYPKVYGLDRLWTGNMLRTLRMGRAEGERVFPGGEMPGLYHRVGFREVKVGAGTTVYGSREERAWFAGRNREKLAVGDPYRESWVRAGVDEGDIEEATRAFKAWEEDDGGWYVATQAEVLGWK
ncbi:S-adenosyl-L-methionine-dependent methyltransferase [Cercophora samala]|uniref:S-adenosyl-L-methionine-dependent methyltransferase n=1 Tax=Cercophora samala TaxID=330535 RepID=A0AA39ZID7_9PEZI|nr:S-adenosyl-L-methionine-dependent methyltransferase [Cercophora samala]